jgi:hypothetical protein
MLYFDDDTTSLEASVSDEHEHLYKLMEANKMKPCHLTVNLESTKGNGSSTYGLFPHGRGGAPADE